MLGRGKRRRENTDGKTREDGFVANVDRTGSIRSFVLDSPCDSG